jgi:hypothetical protein
MIVEGRKRYRAGRRRKPLAVPALSALILALAPVPAIGQTAPEAKSDTSDPGERPAAPDAPEASPEGDASGTTGAAAAKAPEEEAAAKTAPEEEAAAESGQPGSVPADPEEKPAETETAPAGEEPSPVPPPDETERAAPRYPEQNRELERDPRNAGGVSFRTSSPGVGTAPAGPRLELAGELGFAVSDIEGATGYWLSPLLGGWLRVEDTIAISVDWGFVSLSTSPDPTPAGSGSVVGLGNPFVGVHSVRHHEPTELRVGVGMSVPVASLSGTDREAAWDAYYGAMAMRGMWEWWLWVPDSMTLAVPVEWDSVLDGKLEWGGSVSLAATVILDKPQRTNVFLREDPRTADLLIPFALYGGYRFGNVALGSHLQNVFVASGKTELQLSVSPYLRLTLGDGHLDARFTINVDKPMGFAFSDRGFWGAHLGGGYGLLW